jgi:hypothetical protein
LDADKKGVLWTSVRESERKDMGLAVQQHELKSLETRIGDIYR